MNASSLNPLHDNKLAQWEASSRINPFAGWLELPLSSACTSSVQIPKAYVNISKQSKQYATLKYSSLFHRSCKFLPPPRIVAQGCSGVVKSTVSVLLERFGAATSTLRSYIMFVATERSGHSLIGSLLDAHPSLIVANEADAIGWFQRSLASQNRPPRSEMFRYLYENSLSCALFTRWQHDYNYTVPHQANGQFVPGELLAIGDKKGGHTVMHLTHWENQGDLEEQWRKWEAYVALPITVIHVWWADQWSTPHTSHTRRLLERIVGAGNMTRAFEWNNTAFIRDPTRMIPKVCKLLRIPRDDRLQSSWAGIMNPNITHVHEARGS